MRTADGGAISALHDSVVMKNMQSLGMAGTMAPHGLAEQVMTSQCKHARATNESLTLQGCTGSPAGKPHRQTLGVK